MFLYKIPTQNWALYISFDYFKWIALSPDSDIHFLEPIALDFSAIGGFQTQPWIGGHLQVPGGTR